jgi:hypothetical protein
VSTKEEEILVDILIKDLYQLFYNTDDVPLTPVVYSRIIKFIRDFTNNPNFILGESIVK